MSNEISIRLRSGWLVSSQIRSCQIRSAGPRWEYIVSAHQPHPSQSRRSVRRSVIQSHTSDSYNATSSTRQYRTYSMVQVRVLSLCPLLCPLLSSTVFYCLSLSLCRCVTAVVVQIDWSSKTSVAASQTYDTPSFLDKSG